jgi:uncharacterized protein YecE (DUF72 family)
MDVMRNELKIEKEADYGEVAHVPTTSDLGELRRKAAKCQACPLFHNATQTVFGEGGAGRVVYFNNDMNARAPWNAFRLMQLIGSSALPLPRVSA